MSLAMARTRAGIAIQAQMSKRGLTQSHLARRLGKSQTWVSQSLLDDTERTVRRLWVNEPDALDNLIGLLGLTLNEFEHAVGLSIGGASAIDDDADHLGSGRLEIPGGLVMVQVMGMANGGKPTEYGVPVDPDLVRGDNTRAYQVDGDSMDTGDERGIKDRDWVLIDTSLTSPVNGKVYLLEIIGDGMTVKRLRKLDGAWRFISDNPLGDSWRDDQVKILGQAYGRVNYGKIV